jgi:hypothetical protein
MTTIFQRRRFFLLAAILAALTAGFSTGIAECQDSAKSGKFPRCILIIRHAEKTGSKTDVHLSETGKERAKLLPALFMASTSRTAPFPTPDFIFAARKSTDSQRPGETVTPLAMKLKLPINDDYHSSTKEVTKIGEKRKGANELRDELFSNAKYAGKTILICWRHGAIVELAKTLKVDNIPAKWEDGVFDRVWQISYDKQGKVSFFDRPQRLMAGDSPK